MQRLINDIKSDLNKNRVPNYGGFFMVFSLIDVCAYAEYKNIFPDRRKDVAKRYKKWLDNYYVTTYDPNNPEFESNQVVRHEAKLNADEFYGLRCKVLHEATVDKTPQVAGSAKRQVCFSNTSCGMGGPIKYGNYQILSFNTNRFIADVIYCIEQWMSTKQPNDYRLDFDLDGSLIIGPNGKTYNRI